MIPQRLRMLILKQLAERPRTGYGLIKDIHEHTGWKPSYGSIYPQLEHMREEGLVTFKEVGNKKVYSLTPDGRKAQQEIATHYHEMRQKVQDSVKMLSHMMGLKDERHEQMIRQFFTTMEKGDPTLEGVLESIKEMKMTFWEAYNKGVIQRRQAAVNRILKEAAAKIRALK